MLQHWSGNDVWAAPARFFPTTVFSVAAALTFAVAYFMSARLGLALQTQPDGVAVFWPAAGVSTGVLVGLGARARLPVIVGVVAATIAANLLGDRNLASSAVFAACNSLEAVLIASLIERYFGPRFELDRLSHVIGFVVAAIVGCCVSGIGGTAGYLLFHHSQTPALTIWSHWFASDGIGVVTVAPFLIGLVRATREVPSLKEAVEGAAGLILLACAGALLIFAPYAPWDDLAIATIFPLILWISARGRPAFAAMAVFIIAITIVSATTFNIDFFGMGIVLPTDHRILTSQIVILSSALCALVLGALFSERRNHTGLLVEGEHRLQHALKAGKVTAFDWDVHSGHTERSENAAHILGLDSKRDASTASFLERIHPDDRARFKSCLAGLRPEFPWYVIDFRYIRPDGKQIWLEESAEADFDQRGRIVHVGGLTFDITERKLIEKMLANARKTAERANRAKSAFLAAASHDLRQPLQTLKILQGILQKQVHDSAAVEPINAIGRSLRTMSEMLTSLLDINQLESGNLVPRRSAFPVSNIFESLATDFADVIEDKGLELRIVRSAYVIHSDQHMLGEMIRNLLSNAVRYTERGRILLGCRRAGNSVRIEVWDSGVGIMGEHLPHIFEEYYRSPENPRTDGFGLGLAIVQRLGSLLGHHIDVRSTPGKGSAFSVLVPLGHEGPVAELSEPSPPIQFEPLRSQTVLVIEDEMSVRAALEMWLRSEGLKVVSVTNGNDALALTTDPDVHFDLVLSDYNIPGRMNGLETVCALRTILGGRLPAILLTGDMRSDVVQSIAKYDVGIAIKPVKVDVLLKLIHGLLADTEVAVHSPPMREAGAAELTGR